MGEHELFWMGRLAIRPDLSNGGRSSVGGLARMEPSALSRAAATRYGDIRERMMIAARSFPHFADAQCGLPAGVHFAARRSGGFGGKAESTRTPRRRSSAMLSALSFFGSGGM